MMGGTFPSTGSRARIDDVTEAIGELFRDDGIEISTRSPSHAPFCMLAFAASQTQSAAACGALWQMEAVLASNAQTSSRGARRLHCRATAPDSTSPSILHPPSSTRV